MPSPTLKRTRRRALKLSSSFATAIRSAFFCSWRDRSPPATYAAHRDQEKPVISRPQRLRRKPIPVFRHYSFIHYLPVEILAHIFVLGAEDDDMLPITVSHVCYTWREIALRTPPLWRRIHLDCRMDMWAERIYRAGSCSLDIQITPYITTCKRFVRRQVLDFGTVQWYIHCVLPYVQRWRSFEVVFTQYSPFLLYAALSACCTSMSLAPLLERLTLVYRANDDARRYHLFSGFAPRLRHVTLDGLRLAWTPSMFGDLTHLDYTHHGFTSGVDAVDEVMTILEVSARLVDLRICFPPKSTASRHSRLQRINRRLTLPHLSRLCLRVEGLDIPFELAHLTSIITTPRLTSLRLIDANRYYHSFPRLKSFFHVYSIPSSLIFLRIEHGWYDPMMVPSLLHALPHMRQVIVKKPHTPEQVINLKPRFRDNMNFETNPLYYSYPHRHTKRPRKH